MRLIRFSLAGYPDVTVVNLYCSSRLRPSIRFRLLVYVTTEKRRDTTIPGHALECFSLLCSFVYTQRSRRGVLDKCSVL